MVPGSAHFSYGQFTNDDWDGPGSYVASNSGPSIYEAPAIIHPPNSPVGDTDENGVAAPGGITFCYATARFWFIKHVHRSVGVKTTWASAEQPLRQVFQDFSVDWAGDY